MSDVKYPFPNALISGFPRCGTTSLVRQLNQSNKIDCIGTSSPEPKAVLNWSGNLEKLREFYFSQFADTSNLRIEKSTTYSESPNSFHVWQKINPDMKWIFVIRRPFERIVSNYNWSVRNGFEKLSLHDALLRSIKGDELEIQPKPFDYIWRTLYGLHLTNWIRYNDYDKLLISKFENLSDSSLIEVARIRKFIGDDSIPTKVETLNHENQSFGSMSKHDICSEIKSKLALIFKDDLALLSTNFPQLDLSAWEEDFV